MADIRERIFQNDIIAALSDQGWLVGKASEYDKVSALYPEDLVGPEPG
jgi:type I restriction enzyme R subunit